MPKITPSPENPDKSIVNLTSPKDIRAYGELKKSQPELAAQVGPELTSPEANKVVTALEGYVPLPTVIETPEIAKYAYPKTPEILETTNIHFFEFTNPFSWLTAKLSDLNEKVKKRYERLRSKWVTSQEKLTKEALTVSPEKQKLLEAKAESLLDYEQIKPYSITSDSILAVNKTHSQEVIETISLATNEVTNRIDIKALIQDDSAKIEAVFPDNNSKYIIVEYRTDTTGKHGSLAIIDRSMDQPTIKEIIPGILQGGISWLPDGESFLYRQHMELDETGAVTDKQVRHMQKHAIGKQTSAEVIYSNPDSTANNLFVDVFPGSKWWVKGNTQKAEGKSLSIIKYNADNALEEITLVENQDQTAFAQIHNNYIYVRTDKNTIQRIELTEKNITNIQQPENWETVFQSSPDQESALLTGISFTKDSLIIHSVSAQLSTLYKVSLAEKGAQPSEIKLPINGIISKLITDPSGDSISYTIENASVPSSTYRDSLISPNLPSKITHEKLEHQEKTASEAVIQTLFIPFTLPNKNTIQLPTYVLGTDENIENQPILIFPYGHFGLPVEYTKYNPLAGIATALGWRFAYVTLPGDQNFRQYALGDDKQNTIDALANTIQYFVEQQDIKPEQIAVMARSGGAYTAANLIIQEHPYINQLAGIILESPLLNGVTYIKQNGQGKIWKEDLGSGPQNLLRSPIHNIISNQPHPPIYVRVGSEDNVISLEEAMLYAALLQQNSGQSHPILFETIAGMAHSVDSLTTKQKQERLVNIMKFLQINLNTKKPNKLI